MARMIGRAGGRRFTCGCCDWSVTKRGQIAKELKQVFQDVEDEIWWMEDKAHERGMCYDPATKSYGCKFCEDLDDAYDNADLDDIPGVWCNLDWREDPDVKRLLQEEEIWATRLSQSHRTEADGA